MCRWVAQSFPYDSFPPFLLSRRHPYGMLHAVKRTHEGTAISGKFASHPSLVSGCNMTLYTKHHSKGLNGWISLAPFDLKRSRSIKPDEGRGGGRDCGMITNHGRLGGFAFSIEPCDPLRSGGAYIEVGFKFHIRA